eukprot:206857_1
MRTVYHVSILLSLAFLCALADPLDRDIYKSASHLGMCVRLLSTTGRFGCATRPSGSRGTLYLVDSEEKLANMSKTEDTVVVMPSDQMSSKRMLQLKNTSNVKGILLLNSDSRPTAFSGQMKSPQKEFLPPGITDFEWNPSGNSLLFEEFPFGVLLLNRRDSVHIQEFAEKNDDWRNSSQFPAYASEMNFAMSAKNNSLTCLEKNRCLPLGDYSVWATYNSSLPASPDTLLSVVSTRIDTAALFHNDAVGANSALSGLIAMMAAAHTLIPFKERLANKNKQLVFMAFTGEALGFVGSRKFFSDVQNEKNFTCDTEDPKGELDCLTPFYASTEWRNFSLDKVGEWLDLQQVGNHNDVLYKYFIEGNPTSSNIEANMQTAAKDLDIQINRSTEVPENAIPPSSLWAMFQSAGFRDSGKGFVLTDHNGPFVNQFYDSQWDVPLDSLNVDRVTTVATWLARYLATSVAGVSEEERQKINVDRLFVNQLVECFTEENQPTCPLIREFMSQSAADSTHYAGVFRITTPDYADLFSQFIFRFFANATSLTTDEDSKCTKQSECVKKDGQRRVCAKKKCVSSGTFFHPAVDPLLKFNYDTELWNVSAARKASTPLYAESNWSQVYTIIFRRESPTAQLMMFIAGWVVTGTATVAAIFAHKFCKHRFTML